ncbi:MAG TPA: DUF4136 domain-containing protein [Polyangiaceae bacterium]|nr:DUF4136 domain-containing protein [Polyangiaceae bacterium]
MAFGAVVEVVAIGCALAAVGCASTADIHTIKSPAAHFELYHSVAFDSERPPPPGDYSSSPQSADVWSHVKDTATHILQSRGYTLGEPGKTDLILRIEVGRRESTAPMTSPIGLQPTYPGYVPDYLPVAPPYHGYFDQESQELVEGAFVIDAFDGKSHELLWHGFSRAVIRPGQVNYADLQRHVESVLASFPASGSR